MERILTVVKEVTEDEEMFKTDIKAGHKDSLGLRNGGRSEEHDEH